MTATFRNPAAEATALLGAGFSARVLEPSPPAVLDEPFFADDPAATGAPESPGDLVVTPTTAGDRTWDDIVAERPELGEFARENWLGNRAGMAAVPSGYDAARRAHHRLSYAIVAEARRLANGKFGLRYTRGGYGTPFFVVDGAHTQVRVEGNLLVVQAGDEVRSGAITTLRAAADLVGLEPGTAAAEHDSPPLGDLDEPLPTTPAVGVFIGAWFGFAWAVLEELRLTEGAVEVERPQLWPGHFDPALAMGDADTGRRATYGLSPGDDGNTEPYLYVAAWGAVDADDPYWNADSFSGASMSHAELRAAADPHATALGFFCAGHRRLTA